MPFSIASAGGFMRGRGNRNTLAAAVLSAAALFVCTAAFAGDTGGNTRDVLACFYGNTLIAKDGDIVSHFWYKPNHTFTGTVPAYYLVINGTWSEKEDGTICRVFDPPLPTVKNPDCGPMLVRKPGEVAADGSGHKEKLVVGIQ
jgi:hypothetical protein